MVKKFDINKVELMKNFDNFIILKTKINNIINKSRVQSNSIL